MDDELLKINILTITVAGFLMMLTGVVLYFSRGMVADNIRFFLPIPPLGVAAYLFVFSMFRYYGGNLPGDWWDILRELVKATAIAGIVFCGFITVNILITAFLKERL